MPGGVDPISRFVRAATYLKTLPVPQSQMEAFTDALAVIRTTMVPPGAEDISANGKTGVQAWPTLWVTAADLTHKIYYFSSTQVPNIVLLDLKQHNFAPGQPILELNPSQIKLNLTVTN